MRDVPQQILRLPIFPVWSTAGIYQAPRLNSYSDGIQAVGDGA